MELFTAEAEQIRKLVDLWISHPEYELETTFGAGGRVDSVTFLTVAQRLRAKGYTSLTQADMMTISTPEHVRFSLSGLGVVEQYCRTDNIVDAPFSAMIKDRATPDGQVDLDDYDVRVKLRRETQMARDDGKLREMFASWPQQRKAFRLLRRWTFEKEGEGIRFDLSMVRSTKAGRSGEFRWQRRFRDQDVTMAPPTYEIEVEMTRLPGDTKEDAVKRLVKGVGEVLRGIQKHTFLIRKSQKEKVLSAYKELTGTDLFRGPALKVLMRRNFIKEREKRVPNIRDGYNVTDEADGLRTMGFVDGKGDLYLIDMGMNVYRTGLRRPELRLSLVDGEWVTKTKDQQPMQQFLVFDILYALDRKDVSQYPFQPGAVRTPAKAPPGEEGGAAVAAVAPPPPEESRHNQLKAWVTAWNKDEGPKPMIPGITAKTKLQVSMKEYHFARAGDDSIFRLALRVLTAARPYYTDGLIFTPNAEPLPSRPAATFDGQFKWKPPRDNTIDFFVKFERVPGSKTEDKVTVATKPVTGELVTYKTLRLYVGSRTENPRDVILNEKDLPKPDETFAGRRGKDYKPVIFTPKEFPDPMASVCHLEIQRDPDAGTEYVMTEHGNEPIQDATIVEMAYDPSEAPGWRWKPLRVRMDKTERLQRGILSRTLNSEIVAEETWNSIYDPVSESMIRTGNEQPSEAEVEALGADATFREQAARRYFERKGPVVDVKLVSGLRAFHNRWIKEKILYTAGLSGAGKSLLDLACGQANDLHIWRRVGVNFVLGVDYAAKNILDTHDGAYARYASTAAEAGGMSQMEPMVFAIADTSKPLVNPPAGNNGGTDEDKDILRAVFGRVKPQGGVGPYVAKLAEAPPLKEGADCVSCMFAIHYFFETQQKFNGFLRNLADALKVGGYFIGCCFDGERVFNALRGLQKGESRVGMEGKDSVLWKITKEYSEDDSLPEGDAGFGIPINVEFVTIGMGHTEHLVPFRLLEEKLRLVGCELLTREELQDIGLVNSTTTFDESYEMAKRRGQDFTMGPAARDFSFMNRWFIFKRKRLEMAAEAAAAEATAAAAASATAGATGNGAAGASAAVATAPNNRTRGQPVGREANARAAARAAAAAATEAQKEMAATEAAANTSRRNNNAAAATAAAGTPAAVLAGAAAAAANAVPGTAPARTIPVAAGPAAAPGKTYGIGELFQFYGDAAVKDILGIKDLGAGRWLSPSAPFPIEDPEDRSVIYPSVEHFLAGMRIKRASNKPDLAATLFGREGTIHQRFLNDRLIESAGGTKPISEARDHELLKTEIAAVRDAARPPPLKKYGAVVDEAKWAAAKNDVLREALNQRWTKDARFRKIIEAARDRGKYLLYYTPGAATSNVGGVRRADGKIEGENLMGRIMMELAGYPK